MYFGYQARVETRTRCQITPNGLLRFRKYLRAESIGSNGTLTPG